MKWKVHTHSQRKEVRECRVKEILCYPSKGYKKGGLYVDMEREGKRKGARGVL
jgi:hypothetical protein